MAGGIIGKVTAGGGTHLVTSTFYGTCTTASNLATKEVKLVDATQTSATFITGMTLAVKFTYSNTTTVATELVVKNSNGTELLGRKVIKLYGTTAPSNTPAASWRAGAVVLFIYDGTNWVMATGMDDFNDKSVQIVRW